MSGMVNCPRCGTANAPTHRACIACGTKLQSGHTPDAFGNAPLPPPPGAGGSAGVSGVPGVPPDAGASPIGPPPGAPAGAPPLAAPPPGAPPPLGPPPGAQVPPETAPAPPAPPGVPAAPAPAVRQPEPFTAGTIASAQPASARGRLVGFLVTYDLNPDGLYYPVYEGHSLVGRKDAAPGLDVGIEHPTVSSNHAAFHLDSNKHMAQVEDLQSANGTLLNNTAIAGQGRREVRDGDRLRFGGVNVVLKLVEPI
jgi:hypothetical protein